jgi:hypothetical protein
MTPYVITIAISIVICAFIVNYEKIRKWVLTPKRKCDFEYRLHQYWFKEGIAYSDLASKTSFRFYEGKDGRLHMDAGNNEKFLRLFGTEVELPLGVQKAYKQYIHKEFEKIMLSTD